MFDNLSTSLSKIFDKLKSRGYLSEDDVNQALREIRIALLEADVALPVVKDFVEKVKADAIGKEVHKSITPAQLVVKIVNDKLVEILGSDNTQLNLSVAPPAVIMMIGLQGAGKTTSCAKIAFRLKSKLNKKILLASLDTYRPAAQEQLSVLGKQVQIDVLPIISGQKPEEIAKRAQDQAKTGNYDVLILDTAGRLHTDNDLIEELIVIDKITSPVEKLLVVDSLTGQDAVNIASLFKEKVGVTGIVMTRADGDARGGAALSMKFITGAPIKFLGVGERVSDLEEFFPERIASRILDMGDVVSLVEKAMENIDEQEAIKMAKKVKKGQFDMNDIASQLKMIKKMGGVGDIMSMLPGIGKFKEQIADAKIDNKKLDHQLAIISSMTKQEKINPQILNASRKIRIAKGAGRTVNEVNILVKQHRDMQNMMKKVGKMNKKEFLRSKMGKLFS
jgi:signal recognition particle subunit SRP54